MILNEFRWGVKPNIPGQWHAARKQAGFEIQIAQDWIEARIEDAGQQDCQRIHAEKIVQALLRSIGVSEKIQFTGVLGSVSQLDTNSNRRDVAVSISGMHMKVRAHAVDVVVTSSGGTVLADSRAERLSGAFEFGADIAGNETLRRMTDYLLEYHSDSEKKMSPLFDISELAKEVFNTEQSTASALGLSHNKFKQARRIMNDSTVRTGRHRGQELGIHREPTPAESALCEGLTEQIVRGFASLVRRGMVPK